MSVLGRIHSIQSMGTLDGPGVRFVIFMQGCNLRCKCCHNPDTWSVDGGTVYTPEDLIKKIIRFREYFGRDGGVTLSGGEPLLQADFAHGLFELCHREKINTCIDTSGSVLNDAVKKLLTVTDRVLLDIKYTKENLYRDNVGFSLQKTVYFLDYINENDIPTTLRQVIIPELNDNIENIVELKNIALQHRCVDKIELLPFRKICQTKYDNMGIVFPFSHIPEPDADTMDNLKSIIKEYV